MKGGGLKDSREGALCDSGSLAGLAASSSQLGPRTLAWGLLGPAARRELAVASKRSGSGRIEFSLKSTTFLMK